MKKIERTIILEIIQLVCFLIIFVAVILYSIEVSSNMAEQHYKCNMDCEAYNKLEGSSMCVC